MALQRTKLKREEERNKLWSIKLGFGLKNIINSLSAFSGEINYAQFKNSSDEELVDSIKPDLAFYVSCSSQRAMCKVKKNVLSYIRFLLTFIMISQICFLETSKYNKSSIYAS